VVGVVVGDQYAGRPQAVRVRRQHRRRVAGIDEQRVACVGDEGPDIVVLEGRQSEQSHTIGNMPAHPSSRQPVALDWFAGAHGRGLLAAEQAAVEELLVTRPAQPWLRLAAAAVPALSRVRARGVSLYRAGAGFRGDVDCALPLPLATESIGSIIIQHAEADGSDDLLEECARVLVPGGRLWLFTLNPWSPYRARWHGRGLRAREAAAWSRALDRLGLETAPGAPGFLGPVWHPNIENGGDDPPVRASRWRAVRVYEAEKRSAAPALPKPALRWRTRSSMA